MTVCALLDLGHEKWWRSNKTLAPLTRENINAIIPSNGDGQGILCKCMNAQYIVK
jgi:hypothetical protein